jgi:glycosyltransferase involved in cell wall biosynthesis
MDGSQGLGAADMHGATSQDHSRIRILTFSTLYPNASQPQHGVFVENRLRHLVASGKVEATVMAPSPWFPTAHPVFGGYARYARVPRHETRHGFEIYHPPYIVVPKVGMSIAPLLLYAAARSALRALIASGRQFDLIDAHYFYPDGVSAVMLGREFGLPVVITGRGADLNQIPEYSIPRRQVLWAARHAAGLVTVCQSLKESLVALGGSADKVRVLRNGVSLDQFRPMERETIRREFGLAGPTLVSVGALIPRKGHDLVIQALSDLPNVSLLIAGEGPEREYLKSLASRLGLTERVRFLGQLAHEQLAPIYNAADVSVLASSSEGWANVLLEAMACGTPVAATNVSGTPEVVQAPEAGVLIETRTPVGIATAIRGLLAQPPLRAATRAYAETFSWEETTQGQLELFQNVLHAGLHVRPPSRLERTP